MTIPRHNSPAGRLPETFIPEMKALLPPQEFKDFLDSFEDDPCLGLRVNTLKISVEDFLRITPFTLRPVPWAENGFYYEKHCRPAKHPYYEAGLYYLQEPSAMLPVEVLNPGPDSRVLDLCAAPGGKSTQLAEKMQNRGTLVVNDNNPKRTIALLNNLVRMGVTNVVVCNSRPETFRKTWAGFFTHLLIDAPCSGEGMFRREPGSISQLGVYSVEDCQRMQREILEVAVPLLEPEGRLVYATCTFNTRENENQRDWLLEVFPGSQALATHRIWPHKEEGEGQFATLLQVSSPSAQSHSLDRKNRISSASQEIFSEFIRETLVTEWQHIFLPERFVEREGQLFYQPEQLPDFGKVNVLRPGWFIGEIKKGRFIPAHDLVLGLPAAAFSQVLSFSAEDTRLQSYLKGETLLYEYPGKGWIVIAVDNYPLGWCKKDGTILKNYYPKNIRRMD